MTNRLTHTTRTLAARRVLVLGVALTSLATPIAFASSASSDSGVTVANASATAKQDTITSLAAFEKTVRADRTVTRKQVTFKNGELDMAGVQFAPAKMKPGRKYPAILVVHPAGGIKEQTASLYAYRMAQQGYIALAYDASHQGQSEGQPRLLEDPAQRVEDARSAVDYLTTLRTVDRERIAALGICAGGGYAINATMTDHRIKAVAGVASFNYGDGVRQGWRGTGTAEELRAGLEDVAQERTAVANGAQPTMLPYVPDSAEGVTEPDMVEASEYYRQADRWKHENSPNRYLKSSMDKIYAFDAFDGIDTLLTQPLLLITGSEAGSKWHSDRAYKEANGEKELFVVPGGTHMSMYDKDVNRAVPKLAEFFGKQLKHSAN
ncbi:alpha/beta hydrolase [Streptomyces sp. ALI-76-A]|uniref:alpha/beta hydrolase n=1 Tax=Streptomyces sp. ALI-76-A TaxID=3025736 RepID=UPI00256EC554|nr:alpha/beta hydrolase [Streptomyces sp. ALI-76-A]MDL5206611.1 alpha/beta hydrolase [Streptomyces sp. ALI-76-A]